MTIMDRIPPKSPSRRAVLASGAGLLLAFHVPSAQADMPPNGIAPKGSFAPNAFIRIDHAGKTTLVMPQVEMGQGVYTSIPMIIAEELDVALNTVTLEAAPPSDKIYGNPIFGVQATGNSNSVRAFWKPLRTAGAATRAMLVQAAAKQWKVDPASCTTANSEVIHAASGRKLGYGALVGAAALEKPPANPVLKAPKDFKLIGKPLKRLDTPNKVNGKAMYGIDMMPPSVKFATLAACPVFGGKVGHVDDSAAKAIPGVRQVVVLDDLVAVVGDNMWAAKKGLEALNITWNEGANAHVDTAQVWKQSKTASNATGVKAKAAGDADKALADGTKYAAQFEMPFLAHATMEPMNCTVHVSAAGCEIWVGTQVCARAQQAAMAATGLPVDKVIVHNQLIGGGFGRRLEVDGVDKAVRIAMKVDGPVKVVWTREEDIQHDLYRPTYYDRLEATLKDGKIDGWHHRITGSAVVARWLPPAYAALGDFDAVDSAIDIPYAIPNLRVEFVRNEPPAVPTGFWRGVGPNNNVFAIESFMDELAKKAGKDPVTFRRDMLGKSPRLKAALDLVAKKANWGDPLPPRTGRGVCVQVAFASFIATIIEAEVDHDGEVKLRRINTAVDTGIAVNPDTIMAQLQGGLIFGLTAALYGEITIDKGRVQQSNFHDYRMLRIDQVPKIEVHLIKSGEAPGGIGETGTTAGPPALRNALFAATGIALRKLPIDRDVLAGEETGMNNVLQRIRDAFLRLKPVTRTVLTGVAVVVALLIVFVVRLVTGPGATDFAGGNTVALAEYHAANPTGVPRELANASLIKRGEYLARAADCKACHTVKGGVPYAGGLSFNLPFGTIYSPNITADKETGIGEWTDAQFLTAIHKGIDDEGEALYPAMPYASYAAMTDADALAIKAYLFSLKPVSAPNKANVLSFPFNQRWLMKVWDVFFSPDKRFEPNTDRSPEWNRGAYIAEALAHCGECHTPRNLAFALDNRHKFGGALTAGWRAYNISGDGPSGVGSWSEAEFLNYLANGHAEGRGTASGPMGEAVDASFSKMTSGDVHALVTYLRTVPAVSSDLPATLAGPAPATYRDPAGLDTRGEKLFAGSCMSCHGWTGKSPIWTQATLTGARAVNDPTATNVAQIIIEGARHKTATGTVFMPAFGSSFSNVEVAALANYVTGRFGSKGSAITAKDVASLRAQASR